jgi:hypothetical protein
VRRKTTEEKYRDNIRKQQELLEEFAAHEIEWANDLILWYSLRKQDMPDDQYRAAAFFINHEYLRKPGSLTLLYEVFLQCSKELPEPTKEIAFDLLAYRYKTYAMTLQKGGFDGRDDW